MAGLLGGDRRRYPIVSIEDGLAEDDWEGWAVLTEESATGSSSSATNLRHQPERLHGASTQGRQRDPGQGEPDRHADRDARRRRLAQGAGYTAVMSHRSGETEDATIADLAVASSAGQIKTGAPSRSRRVAKYNQLLRIEEELAGGGFPGRTAFPKARYAGINGG